MVKIADAMLDTVDLDANGNIGKDEFLLLSQICCTSLQEYSYVELGNIAGDKQQRRGWRANLRAAFEHKIWGLRLYEVFTDAFVVMSILQLYFSISDKIHAPLLACFW